MHVAQFIQRYPPALGGSEAYTRRLCEYLALQGDSVSVWTSDAIELGEMWGKGSKTPPPNPLPQGERGNQSPPSLPGKGVGGLGCLQLRLYTPLHFPARRYLLKALSLIPIRGWQCLTSPCNPICPAMWRDAHSYAGPLDAVHAAALPYSFPIMCGLRLARRRGVPFLLTPFLHLGDANDPHDRTRRQYTKPHLRWLLKQADCVFVQTLAEREAVASLGVASECVVLQGLGVDASECTGGNAASGEVVVGHLANNSFEKGTIDLLRAAEKAWAQGHRFRLLLAGPEMPNFQAFWEGFAHKDRVTRLGILSNTQKRDFFAAIDCFALPSRCDSFGLVLLEAWANAKPNLVYRAGGPAELVRHEVDGLHAACGDVDELAAQLGRLVADEGFRRRLGEAGAARIASEFRWEDKLALVREVITSIATQRNPRRRWPAGREAPPLCPPRPSEARSRTSART